jgi:ATPase component of an ABC transporter with duplicated ATPase domains
MEVLLSVQGLTKEFSGERLFEPVSFIVRDHDRTAILGPNGTGKSTLIKMILGQEEITDGNIIFSKNVTIGYLSQDVIENTENTLYQEALSVFSPLIEEEKKLKELSEQLALHADDKKLLEEYSKLQNDFEIKDGYNYRYKIDMILNMFSFSKIDYDRKISTFSGGEKTRVAFAKLLLINPDILILDEPTNHLDIISIEWLEDYLSSYQGAVLFVSHDIAFVKHLANHILDIDNHVFTMYNANYDNFAKMKKDNYENALAQFKAQEEERARLERFITFYMPKPRFASRARDRVKKLERLNANAMKDPRFRDQKTLSMGLKGEIREGKKLMDFNDVGIGYDTPLISNINFTLYGKDHLAIMGANGIGKSTFGKVLLNELEPILGNIRRYFHMNIGVLRQDIRSYSSDETLFDHFRNQYPKMSNEEIYSGLARYGFTYGESNEKRLCDLSGGELMRVEILQLSLEDYDLLLLDEPTNHLDMVSISELVDALNDYEGTLVIISHDRDFIDKTCNKLLYLYHKTGYYYEGPYEEFKERQLQKIIQEEKEKLELENAQRKEEKKSALLEAKKQVIPEVKKSRLTRESPEKILEKIDRAEKKKKTCCDACYLEENYTDNDKMKALEEEIQKLDQKLEKLYEDLDLAM